MIDISDVVEAQRAWSSLCDDHPERLPAAVMGTCERITEAVEALTRNLADIGYPVRQTRTACLERLDERVAKIERLMQVELPRVLVVFWSEVGGLSFVDLDEYRHVEFWTRRGIEAEFCDGVHIDACTDAWTDALSDEYRSWFSTRLAPDARQWRTSPALFRVTLAPDGYHKDNISGGPPEGMVCDHRWAASCTFGWTGRRRPDSALGSRIDLLAYLRTALLECAGFPGLLGDPAFEEVRPRLLANVPLF